MIICQCLAVSDTQVKQLCEKGMNFHQIQGTLGAGNGCGGCVGQLINLCKDKES